MTILVAVPAAMVMAVDFDPLAAILTIVLIVLSLGCHEAAHAWTAWKLGDSTGKDLGRVTLNPIPHIDLWLTIGLPLLCLLTGMPLFGGAKPVPVNPHRLRNPTLDMAVVSGAGPLTNFVLAMLFFALAKIAVSTGFYNGAAEYAPQRWADLLPSVLVVVAGANVMLFVFNLVPIPPLDGSKVLAQYLPDSVRETYLQLGFYGFILIYILLYSVPAFSEYLWSAEAHVMNMIRSVITLGGRW